MVEVNVSEAGTQLARMIESVLSGEEVFISRDGKKLVRLVPVHQSSECETAADTALAAMDDRELNHYLG